MNRVELPPFEDKGIEWHPGIDRSDPNQPYNPSNTKFFTNNEIYTPAMDYAKSNFEIFIMAIMKQMPGQMFPPHTDSYGIFRFKNREIDVNQVVRYFVFLEDWHPGHYFEFDKKPVTEWRAGDMMMMNNKTLHCSANVGSKPKYTLIITGIPKKAKSKTP